MVRDELVVAGAAVVAAGVGLFIVSQLKPTTAEPVADFVFSPTSPSAGALVQFDASASQASEGTSIISYAWDFGDMTTGSGITTTHAFSIPGLYDVKLTVTDSSGKTGTKTQTVQVREQIRLSGRAVDATFGLTANPVPGMTVELHGQEKLVTYIATSDANGSVVFDNILPDIYLFIAKDPDWVLQGSPFGQLIDGRFSHLLGINGTIYAERFRPFSVRIRAPPTVDVSFVSFDHCCNFSRPHHNPTTHPNEEIWVEVELFDQFNNLYLGAAETFLSVGSPEDEQLEAGALFKEVRGLSGPDGFFRTRYWAKTDRPVRRSLVVQIPGFRDSTNTRVGLPVAIIALHDMATRNAGRIIEEPYTCYGGSPTFPHCQFFWDGGVYTVWLDFNVRGGLPLNELLPWER